MAQIRNTFDGGTNATAMTTANTGGASGTPFAAVEAAALFSSEQAHTPPLSMKTPSTAVSGYGRFITDGGAQRVQFFAYFTAAHAADFFFYQARGTSSSGTAILTLVVNGTNQLRLRIQATSENAWTAASSFPLNQWVRIELLIEKGVTDADGRVRVAYYLGWDATPIEDSGWVSGRDLRGDETPTIASALVGKISTAAYAGAAYFDGFAIDTDTDYAPVFIGPPPAEPLPTPVPVVTGSKNPSAIGAADGELTITWPPVEGATGYLVGIAPGNVTAGFTDTQGTSPHTFTGLAAGEYTFSVIATDD